jgi:hypothetical protein
VAVHGWWWGLALGLAGGAAAVLALPPRWWGRLAFAGGWVLTVGYLTVPRPEGDYVIASDPAGYALLAGTLALMLVAIVTVRAGPAKSSGRPTDA